MVVFKSERSNSFDCRRKRAPELVMAVLAYLEFQSCLSWYFLRMVKITLWYTLHDFYIIGLLLCYLVNLDKVVVSEVQF